MAGPIIYPINTGDRFNSLTAVEPSEKRGAAQRYWMFECDCGRIVARIVSRVARGQARHCGCQTIKANYIDGRTSHPLYPIWVGIKARCTNPNVKSYEHYGAKGIGLCQRWEDFALFAEDMGDKPEGHTIERIDNSIGYCPSNCIWASRAVQSRNRSFNRKLTHNGKTLCVSQWARHFGLKRTTFVERLNRGDTIERASRPLGAT